jgi:hypothetical protein
MFRQFIPLHENCRTAMLLFLIYLKYLRNPTYPTSVALSVSQDSAIRELLNGLYEILYLLVIYYRRYQKVKLHSVGRKDDYSMNWKVH